MIVTKEKYISLEELRSAGWIQKLRRYNDLVDFAERIMTENTMLTQLGQQLSLEAGIPFPPQENSKESDTPILRQKIGFNNCGLAQ